MLRRFRSEMYHCFDINHPVCSFDGRIRIVRVWIRIRFWRECFDLGISKSTPVRNIDFSFAHVMNLLSLGKSEVKILPNDELSRNPNSKLTSG